MTVQDVYKGQPHMHMYAIEDVVKQALSYSQRHNRKVVFAYLLLPGINAVSYTHLLILLPDLLLCHIML